MISEKNYNKLMERFGNIASWAIWQKRGETPKSNMGDLTIFDDPEILSKLNPNVVFVALNASGNHEDCLDKKRPWFNFHSTSPRAQSFKLREALYGTPLWGGYLTDIIKYHKEPNSSKVKKLIKTRPDIVDENIKYFMEELSYLGENPIIVALGTDSYELLKEKLPKSYQIRRMTHYSAQFKYKEVYAQEVANILKDL